jgi:broad specificity phosphatase PhoE
MRALLAALMLAVSPAVAPAAPPAEVRATLQTPVYIVRHMQKAEGSDPALTVEGAANADRLAAMLKDKGVVAIFSTPTRRTMETAAPLAKALGLNVTLYDPANPAALAAGVAAAGGPVLVVGHSNTLPDLVSLFGGAKPAPLSDQDYGTLYEVEPGGGVVTVPVALTPAERGR